MKLSLKFQGHDDHHQHTTQQQQQQLITAKVPLTIFNHPFMSSISAATTDTNSEFSFSLSTNFQSGPSLKLSYFPTTSSSSSSTPFALSLKSGLGLLGSPRHSPLLFSATFTLSPSLTPLPSFSLHFKPQFGHFSLNKTVFSDNPIPKPYSPPTAHNNNNNNNFYGEFSKGLVSNGSSSSSSAWQELKLEPFGASRDNTPVDNNNNNNNNNNNKYTGFVPDRSLVEKKSEKRGLSPGVALMARTVMPVTKGLLLNLRWGVNLPGDSGVKMPYLTVNKIGLERVNVEDVRKSNNDKGKQTSENDLQLLKGMCFWMKRDMEAVERENREMKRVLDEMRMGVSASRNGREGGNGGGGGVLGRKLSRQHSGEGSGDGEFERWRSKKGVREENEKKEQQKKQQSVVSDVESELQKAIKAAANSASS